MPVQVQFRVLGHAGAQAPSYALEEQQAVELLRRLGYTGAEQMWTPPQVRALVQDLEQLHAAAQEAVATPQGPIEAFNAAGRLRQHAFGILMVARHCAREQWTLVCAGPPGLP